MLNEDYTELDQRRVDKWHEDLDVINAIHYKVPPDSCTWATIALEHSKELNEMFYALQYTGKECLEIYIDESDGNNLKIKHKPSKEWVDLEIDND
tara:strand:+ start:943 stop:1227 length:285 start_codon:yes stop_codon:yes gene_type:complete